MKWCMAGSGLERRGLHRFWLTFVDASALVCLQERGIKTVWGTDYDLALEGAAVLPGPPT